MENQSTTTSTSQMHFLLLEQVQFLKVKDDSLLHWELVNVVDAEEEEGCEEGDDDIDEDRDSIGDGFGSWDSSINTPNDAPIEGICHRLLHPDDDDDDDDDADVEVEDHHRHHDDDEGVDADGYGEGQVDDHEDDDDDDDGYDLDDELVPWNVSNKFGRQRMRKLGKRGFSKMHNSKRSPYLFVSPGCVRGKHGLGLKHNY